MTKPTLIKQFWTKFIESLETTELDEYDWSQLPPVKKGTRHADVSEFMYMGHEQQGPDKIVAFKHSDTRCYLFMNFTTGELTPQKNRTYMYSPSTKACARELVEIPDDVQYFTIPNGDF